MEQTYSFGTTLAGPYEQVIQRVKEALKTAGFGVLSEGEIRTLSVLFIRPNWLYSWLYVFSSASLMDS
ncbi:hypothetical protein [Dictyobacter aurantiacus]|uniref:Uncharacterized protein n=1 Tax=Dictyobacter aurantiacus TaxID=1936993 RepID=A0A401Z9Q0_9CHLR|nr:hypothetical protein [Dictyobacter aurantiacus]GCE03526.1 hypothetical protein KDAU_08550 [Dictyobacter aurantiacus]